MEKNTDITKIWRELIDTRIEHYSVPEFAQMMSVHTSQLYAYEKIEVPSFKFLERYAEALGFRIRVQMEAMGF